MTEDQKRAAVERARELMLEGLSQNKAAEQVGQEWGVSGRTVINWASAMGTPLSAFSHERAKTRAANEAAITYAQERRLALSDRFFSKLESLLEMINDAGDAKDLATAYAILTDKRRLEEGQVTERTETRAPANAVEIFEQGRERLRLLRGQ